MGKGHYNQNLSSTAILFEMGTYLIEKDYVISSLPYLADTIDKVMFTTAVQAPGGEESMGEIIAGSSNSSNNGTVGSTTSGTTNQTDSSSQSTAKHSVSVFTSVIGISLGVIAIGLVLALFSQKRKIKLK